MAMSIHRKIHPSSFSFLQLFCIFLVMAVSVMIAALALLARPVHDLDLFSIIEQLADWVSQLTA
jgi:uncharacterized membrane protein YhaH (DUF805 family)